LTLRNRKAGAQLRCSRTNSVPDTLPGQRASEASQPPAPGHSAMPTPTPTWACHGEAPARGHHGTVKAVGGTDTRGCSPCHSEWWALLSLWETGKSWTCRSVGGKEKLLGKASPVKANSGNNCNFPGNPALVFAQGCYLHVICK